MLRRDERTQGWVVDGRGREVLRLRPGGQRLQVAAVGIEGVRGDALLDAQVVEERGHVGRQRRGCGGVLAHPRAPQPAKRCIAAAKASPIMRRNSVPMPG